MQVFSKLTKISKQHKKVYITIGAFDGVHLGHLKILEIFKKKSDIFSIVISFVNHPKTFFNPNLKNFLICTNDHKKKLFRDLSIDALFLLSFDQTFANQSAKDFLTKIKNLFNPDLLILGYDACLGSNREGSKTVIEKISKDLNINTKFIEAAKKDNNIISSTLIRNSIKENELSKCASMLGRPYSIFIKLKNTYITKKNNHEYTLLIPLKGYVLPPSDLYEVVIKAQKFNYLINTKLNLSILEGSSTAFLSFNIFNFPINPKGQYIEIIF
jgi:riboflavin kinase/FMN adenylyltransferase